MSPSSRRARRSACTRFSIANGSGGSSEWPEFATAAGVHDFDDKLSDASPETLARQEKDSRAFLAELQTIDPKSLPEDEQANYDIFREQLSDRVSSYRFGEQDLTMNADSGFHTAFAQIWQGMPFQTAKDYRNYIARLRAFPRFMDQNIALMREGLKRGMTIPKATLVGAEDSVSALITDDPGKQPAVGAVRARAGRDTSRRARERPRRGPQGDSRSGRAGVPEVPRLPHHGIHPGLPRDARGDGAAEWRRVLRRSSSGASPPKTSPPTRSRRSGSIRSRRFAPRWMR